MLTLVWITQGRDEVCLCSLSNFDAYFVTRLHKAPKPFIFAVKSTDNLSFFENTADYLHIFSCNQKEGEKWMEAILLARVSPIIYLQDSELTAILVICHVPGTQCPLQSQVKQRPRRWR